jgi:mannose-1-phosphate guanylyltransferase
LGDKLTMKNSKTQTPNARNVIQFREKPDAKTAAKYLARGDYRWNAGMFV